MVKQSTSVTREPTNCKALKPTVTNRKKKKKEKMFGGYGTIVVRDLETAIQLCPQQYIV